MFCDFISACVLQGNYAELAKALSSGKCPQGLKVSLRLNQIGAAGAKDFAEALRLGNCPQGLRLDLGFNRIGDAGAKDLAEALQLGRCPQGLQLYLSYNHIGDVGAKYLAKALSSGECPQGLQLDLSYSQIGDVGAKFLANALQSGNCRQGLQLVLAYSQIGAAGSKYLAKALRSGKCSFGLKIYGLSADISSLCQKNDGRINFEKIEALLSFITMAGDRRFPGWWFYQMLEPYLPGNNPLDELFASVSSIRKARDDDARDAGHQERPNVYVGNFREETTRCSVACCVIS